MSNSTKLPYPCRITVFKEDGKEGKSYEFLEQRSWCIMGRHEDCDIRIQAIGIATLHALIQVNPEGVTIQGLDGKYPIDFPRLNKSVFYGQPVTVESDEIFVLGARKFRVSYERVLHPVTPSNSTTALPDVEPVVSFKNNRSKRTPERTTRYPRRRRSSLVVTGSEETFVATSADPDILLQQLPPSTSSNSIDLSQSIDTVASSAPDPESCQPSGKSAFKAESSSVILPKTASPTSMSPMSSTRNASNKAVPAHISSSGVSSPNTGKGKKFKPAKQGSTASVPRTPQSNAFHGKDASDVFSTVERRSTTTPHTQRKLPFTIATDNEPEILLPRTRSPQIASSSISRLSSRDVKFSASHDEDGLPPDHSFDNLSSKEQFELKFARLSRGLSATPRRGEPFLPAADERILKKQTPALKSVRRIGMEDEGLKSLTSPQPSALSKGNCQELEEDYLRSQKTAVMVQGLQSRLETVQISFPTKDSVGSKEEHETDSKYSQDTREQDGISTELQENLNGKGLSLNIISNRNTPLRNEAEMVIEGDVSSEVTDKLMVEREDEISVNESNVRSGLAASSPDMLKNLVDSQCKSSIPMATSENFPCRENTSYAENENQETLQNECTAETGSYNATVSPNILQVGDDTLRDVETSSTMKIMDNQDNEVISQQISATGVSANDTVRVIDANIQACESAAVVSNTTNNKDEILDWPREGVPKLSAVEALDPNLGNTETVKVSFPQSIEDTMKSSQPEAGNQDATMHQIATPTSLKSEIDDLESGENSTTRIEFEPEVQNTEERLTAASPAIEADDVVVPDSNMNESQCTEHQPKIPGVNKAHVVSSPGNDRDVVSSTSEEKFTDTPKPDSDFFSSGEGQAANSPSVDSNIEVLDTEVNDVHQLEQMNAKSTNTNELHNVSCSERSAGNVRDTEMSDIQCSKNEISPVNIRQCQKPSSSKHSLSTEIDARNERELMIAPDCTPSDVANEEEPSIVLEVKVDESMSVNSINGLAEHSEVTMEVEQKLETKTCTDGETSAVSPPPEDSDCQDSREIPPMVTNEQKVPREFHSRDNKIPSISSDASSKKSGGLASPCLEKTIELVDGTQSDPKVNLTHAGFTNLGSNFVESNESSNLTDILAPMDTLLESTPSVSAPDTPVRGKETIIEENLDNENVSANLPVKINVSESCLNESEGLKEIPEPNFGSMDEGLETEIRTEEEIKENAGKHAVSDEEVLMCETADEHRVATESNADDNNGTLDEGFLCGAANICLTSARIKVSVTKEQRNVGSSLDHSVSKEDSALLRDKGCNVDDVDCDINTVTSKEMGNRNEENANNHAMNDVSDFELNEDVVAEEKLDSFISVQRTEGKDAAPIETVDSTRDSGDITILSPNDDLKETLGDNPLGTSVNNDGASPRQANTSSYSAKIPEKNDKTLPSSMTMTTTDLETMKVKELQALLKQYGLSASGKKRDLVARLWNHIASTKEKPCFSIGSDLHSFSVENPGAESEEFDGVTKELEINHEIKFDETEEKAEETLAEDPGKEKTRSDAEELVEERFSEQVEKVTKNLSQGSTTEFLEEPMEEALQVPSDGPSDSAEEFMEESREICTEYEEDQSRKCIDDVADERSGQSLLISADDTYTEDVEGQSTQYTDDVPNIPRRELEAGVESQSKALDHNENEADSTRSDPRSDHVSQETIPPAAELTRMKVKDLQAMLKDRNMSVGGRKQELIDRLLGVEPSSEDAHEVQVELTPVPKTPRSTRKLARTPSIALSATRRSARISRRLQTAESKDESSSPASTDSEESSLSTDAIPLQELDNNTETNEQKEDCDRGNDSCDSTVESKVREFRKKTVKELRKLLSKREVDIPLKARKDDLIDKLVALTLDDKASSGTDTKETLNTDVSREDKALSHLTVKELRSRLEDMGLCRAGTKTSLVQRIQTALDGCARRTRHSASVDESICSACRDGNDCEAS